MDNISQKIQEVLSSDDKLEAFYETLLFEINNDDEPYFKKGRQLLLASLSNSNPDDFFIAICGWSLKSLLENI